MAVADQFETVQKLYIAFYQRPADFAGRDFWAEQVETQGLQSVINAFATSDEATALYGEINNDTIGDVIDAIYQAAFGRVADAEGKAWYIEQFNAGEFTAATIALNVVNGAAGDDATTLNNKVDAADLFTAAVENVAYDEADITAARDFLAGVTTTVPTQAEVDAVVEQVGGETPEEPSTATEALENLQAAQSAKADFLKEAAEIDFVKAATGATTEAKVAAAVTAADASVAAISVNGNAVYATTDTAGVKAAKVADAQAALTKNLSDQTKQLDTAKAEVAKVAGLSSAIDLYNARVATQETTEAALKAATANAAAAEASYETLTGSTIAPDPTSGVVANVIVVNPTTGRLELSAGVTETTNPGVGALLNAVQARVDASAADATAKAAIETAVVAIGYLDFTTGAKNDIGAAFDPVVTAGANSDKLTQAQIQVELNEQSAAAQTAATAAGAGALEFDADGLITTTHADTAFTDAKVAFNTLKGEVNSFEDSLVATDVNGDYTFATTAVTKVQLSEQAEVAVAEKAITDLTDALAELEAAKEVAADLAAANKAIVDAEAVFEDLGIEVPVTIKGTVVGTADSDLFLLSDNAGTIVNFNAQGDDSIYVGADFSLVTLGATETITQRVGDAAVLEIFAKQNGSNVDLYVEQETFAGNGTTQADIVVITLSGMNVSDLTLADGFLTA